MAGLSAEVAVAVGDLDLRVALDETGEPFVERLLGPEGRRALRRHGFLLP